jgi:hypothetical protein
VAKPYLSAIERGERPFYDDIMSMGGVKEKLSLIQGSGEHVSEWIGSGDLFPEATAAIREKMKPRRLVLGLQKTVIMKRFAAHNQEQR